MITIIYTLNEMNDHCASSSLCPGGNCEGCQNGKIWCHDPRCDPNCPDCGVPSNHDRFANIIFSIIVISLIAFLIVYVIAYGHPLSYFYSHKTVYVPGILPYVY